MDYPTYPGTDRTMKLGDHVAVDSTPEPIPGRILTVSIAHGELTLSVQIEGGAVEWCEPAELTYREVSVPVAIPGALADRILELDAADSPSYSVVERMAALIREARANG